MGLVKSSLLSSRSSTIKLENRNIENKSEGQEVKQFNNHWFRIAQELLSRADIEINGTRCQPWDIRVKNANTFKRVLKEGSLGLGESFMDGWWECDRLDMFFYRVMKHRVNEHLPKRLRDKIRIAIARLVNPQSIKRSRTVGKVHYDLGDDLYSRILDSYMQYSCGYWKDAKTLEEAQEAKMRLICEKLSLEPGMRVLDIGCGWGGFASFAAKKYSVSVTGVTISIEQQKSAQERCKGLDVNILLSDYRDIEGGDYDRIVSVGMFEHVGPKNYKEFFRVVDRCLKDGGIFLLHTIGSNKTETVCDEWINKYIFPGGVIPKMSQIAADSEEIFVIEDIHNFGADYDLTLMAWHERFLAAWPAISSNYDISGDGRFKRMFEYYLLSCTGLFRARYLQLWQLVFSRGQDNGLRIPR